MKKTTIGLMTLMLFGLLMLSGCVKICNPDFNADKNECTRTGIIATSPDDKIYCSQNDKICKTYEQCKSDGEPSLAGSICFAGI